MGEFVGEWLSLAFERQGDILVAYIHPEGLVWNGETYEKQNFQYAGTQTFHITRIPSTNWARVRELDNEIVRFIYSKPFKELPQQIRTQTRLYLPPENTLLPVGFGDFDHRLVVYSEHNNTGSRGVRETTTTK